MARRVIGTGTTGTDGSVTIPYTGTGAGLLQMEVETEIDGSIVSEPYNVWDCIFYTDCTTDTGNWEVANSGTASYSSDGVHASGGGLLRLKVNNSTHYFDGTKDLTFDFYLKTANQCALYLVTNSGIRSNSILNIYTGWSSFKQVRLVYDATAHTVTPYVDGTAYTSVDVSSQTLTTCGFQITDWQDDLDVYIKNFKVYYG